jgi:hypothetical protein
MTTQPKTLRLADALDREYKPLHHIPHEAAAELRRLHEINQKLLESLEDLVCLAEVAMRKAGEYQIDAELQDAHAAITKATREQP